MIDARAALQKKARPGLGRLPLDLAKQVEHRRSCRLHEYRHIEQNKTLQYDIQRAVELENQPTENHRMEDALRLGILESLSHPILADMARRGANPPPARLGPGSPRWRWMPCRSS